MPPSLPPNQTLYVKNVPSAKVHKKDLRTALYMLFSTYGPVLDVVALKTMKMRGQAHIVYRDIHTATQAMRALNGSEFLGMKLQIEYAKTRSDVISKLEGTFKLPTTGSGAAAVEVTDVQRSIFNAPAPGTEAISTAVRKASTTVPLRDASEGRGRKRPLEEGADAQTKKKVELVPEDEDSDSDSDVAMEEVSDDDD